MGSTYEACGGCGEIPVPVAYPIGTGYIAQPVLAPPPIVAPTKVLAPPVYSRVIDPDLVTPAIFSPSGVIIPLGPRRVAEGLYYARQPAISPDNSLLLTYLAGVPRPFHGLSTSTMANLQA